MAPGKLLGHLPGCCKKLRKIWVDGGYSGGLLEGVAERFKFCLTVVLRSKESRKFVLLPRRWVMERTFGWLNHFSTAEPKLRAPPPD
jgi:putative transposase